LGNLTGRAGWLAAGGASVREPVPDDATRQCGRGLQDGLWAESRLPGPEPSSLVSRSA
jgi:hypothetical protein